MAGDYILAIDQGTTSTRAILFDRHGVIQGISQRGSEIFTPRPGWVEQDAEEIWADVQQVCRGVLAENGVRAQDVAAMGITNQRETTIVWDKKTEVPVYRAIVWQDRRTADFCDTLKPHAEMIRGKTGLVIDPYFSGTKIRWILDNVEGAREKAARGDLAFGTVDCYVLWCLTGGKVHVTDATNASRTQLFNIVTQAWDDELLDIMGVPRSMLPEVVDNSGMFGTVTPDVMGAEIPVTGMAGDQQAALFGQACFEAGMVKSTYGTGCFVLANVGDTFRESANKMLTTVGYRLGGKTTYAIEGAIFMAGATVQWLRDGLGVISSSSETEGLAASVPDNGGVYLVPAFAGLGAPHWNPRARGMISGLTRGTTRAHVVRAALEAQAYQTLDLLEAMAKDAGFDITEMRVDGGMVANNWLCRFLADMTRMPVLRPKVTETTALGVAYLAGLHVGMFGSLDDIAKTWQCETRFAPQMPEPEQAALYAQWQHALRQVQAG